MDKTKICSNRRNTIKTDLSLLLECLKFQMKCPDLQKQALLTIHSICEKREDNVDLLREMGGVAFVYNLSKSSIVHPDVKETALFTLGTLAEANVYCKNSLCKNEIFADLADCLMNEDIQLKQKRLSVYLLLVLVANNKLGQTLAQNSGCLDVLLNLFRATFPISTEATFRAANATQTYQLWTSVSSALCGCVNNPQNEEGQRICVAAFPVIKIWLQQLTFPQTEIFQPICTFIAMTVANNSCVQESFSACGGLETLALTLGRLASAADTSLLSCQLSVIISKTLSACITDNSSLASGLAQYGVVLHLFSLLASPHLDPEDRLPILLSLGYCTEASEKHQSQLIWCGGLPIIITLLTEDSSEEVRRAATFILQTCKKATICSGVGDPIAKQAENVEAPKHIEEIRSSAREMLHRINLLEKRRDVEGTGALMSSHTLPLEGASKQLEANSQRFKPLFPVRYTKPSEIKCIEELQHTDMKNVIKAPVPYSRCVACVLPFEEVTSHTFESLQSSCHQSCDRHKVLREATKHFRMHHCRLVFEKEHQDPAEAERYSTAEPQQTCKNWTGPSEGEGKVINKNTLPEHRWRKHNGVTLVPLQRRAKKTTFASHNRTDIEMGGRSGHHNNLQKIGLDHSSTKRKRKDFSCEEVGHLLSGVKTYGFSWNLILWSYPFQPGRTNVDLAKKYRRLMKRKAQDASRADS
ncbi:telomere repeats-binding bouquet formation protein 1 isoform X5 [Pundamilia nyererei]|uniref:Telomere repeats-binding bouquet formation protein 1 isoform X5 n=1 Tax=Pundamilia nyererei TaxID=303518 RepID=A0A9Y6JGI5_9CICH|nr:PREDICTED: telomere repeats-binding bouquet formation protein 1 isoform X5 [Pundamilia nyererei]